MTTFKLTPARPDRLALRGVGFVPSVALSIDVDDLPNEPVVATVLGAYVDESPGHIRIGCLFENGSRLELGHWPSWSAACDLAVERAEELYENSVPIVFDKWLDDGRKTKLNVPAASFDFEEFANTWRDEKGQFAHKGYRYTKVEPHKISMENAAGDVVSIFDATADDAAGVPGLLTVPVAEDVLNSVCDTMDRAPIKSGVPDIVAITASEMVEMGANEDALFSIDGNTIYVNCGDHGQEGSSRGGLIQTDRLRSPAVMELDDHFGPGASQAQEMSKARFGAMQAMSMLHYDSEDRKYRRKARSYRVGDGSLLDYVSLPMRVTRKDFSLHFTEFVASHGSVDPSSGTGHLADKLDWHDWEMAPVPKYKGDYWMGDKTLVAVGSPSVSASDGRLIEIGPDHDVRVLRGGVDVTEEDFLEDAGEELETDDDATLTIEELANPWRDEQGRFAPKGSMFSPSGNLVPDVGNKQGFDEITADEQRGDSRPVSAAEFQRLAGLGQAQLDDFAANSAPIDGLDENWDSIKSQAFDEAQESWGGSTIDARTGEFLPDGADKYALTVKDEGISTVFIPENSSRADFDVAMDQAKERFRPILERQNHYLGVFHDDDLNRIDIDPVTVVNTVEEVHTIGAATRAVGGAYNFADGNGYWPPYVDPSLSNDAATGPLVAAAGEDDRHFKGPGEWRRKAKQAEGAPDAPSETDDDASLTIGGVVALSNPFRDQMGRFAEKGYATATEWGLNRRFTKADHVADGGDGVFTVETYDGVELKLSDPSGVLDKSDAREALSGLADVLEMAPIDGPPPEIRVLSIRECAELYEGLGADKDLALEIATDSPGMVIDPLAADLPDSPVTRDDCVNTIWLIEQGPKMSIDDPYAKSRSQWNESAKTVNGWRYTVTHEYAHQRMYRGTDPIERIDATMDKYVRPDRSLRDPYTSMSTYGMTNIFESHAESFADWAITAATTYKRSTAAFDQGMGWTHDLYNQIEKVTGEYPDGERPAPPMEFTVALATEPQELPIAIIETPSGPVLIWADGKIEGNLIKRDQADLTIGGVVAFANPWRDENGRFAPKGYGSVGTTESDVSDAASPVDDAVPSGGEAANPWDDVEHIVVPTWDENGNVVVDPKAKVLAKDLREKAEKAEPEISTHLAELAGDENPVSYDPPPDGELYGFEYRLKAEDKIAEKIMRELDEKPEKLQGDIIAASQEIKDAVRYTIHFQDEDFGERAQSIVDTLRDEGATINVKNTWPPELGKSYKGINAQVTRSDGLRYEIQFHTENSQAVKDTMHKIYEQQRVLPNGSPEWTKLENEMAALSRDLPVPTGAVEVFEIDGEVV